MSIAYRFIKFTALNLSDFFDTAKYCSTHCCSSFYKASSINSLFCYLLAKKGKSKLCYSRDNI